MSKESVRPIEALREKSAQARTRGNPLGRPRGFVTNEDLADALVALGDRLDEMQAALNKVMR